MKIFKFTSIFSLVASAIIFQACVHDDDYATPPIDQIINCDNDWVANKTISEISTLIGSSNNYQFSNGEIFDGYVASSDETGNIYKSIYVQDKLVNPTKAIQIEVNVGGTYTSFPVGSRIKVSADGIYGGLNYGVQKIGSGYDGSYMGRLTADQVKNHVKRSCDDIADVVPTEFNSIAAAQASGVVNTLVKINNVQFQTTGEIYATANTTVNRTIVDTEGNTIIMRNSGYSDFASQTIPSGSGSITCILSKYNSTWQIYIRDTDDVQLNGDRFTVDEDGSGAQGGASGTFDACLDEGFGSYTVDQASFPKYQNNAVVGSRYWQVKTFGNNQYIQMSAYSATGNVKTYFVVPVNFTDADSFSFKTKDGYYTGNGLKVYYTTNYTIGSDIANSTLTDITSSFTISTGTTSGYAASFVNSGSYSLGSLSGNGAIVFSYEGGESSGVTTTYQIDDISIVNNEDPTCASGNTGGGDDGGNTGGEDPSANAGLAFAGGDFENWSSFTGGLNSFGLQTYATQAPLQGVDGTNALHIQTAALSTNPYVFTALARTGLPTTYNRIQFYMKGVAASKSVSLNVYKTDGTYYTFNLGDVAATSVTVAPAAANQYTGSVNTNGQWVLVTLDLSTISDLNVTNTAGSFFALKIGSSSTYDLYFDNFTIE